MGVSPWLGLAIEIETITGWEHGTIHITILWLRCAVDIGLHPITTGAPGHDINSGKEQKTR